MDVPFPGLDSARFGKNPDDRPKSSSLERDADGRIRINLEQPETGNAPANPDSSGRKTRKLVQFFPVSSSPRRSKPETDARIRHPLKGFIGSGPNVIHLFTMVHNKLECLSFTLFFILVQCLRVGPG
jgi:hypothetical protein